MPLTLQQCNDLRGRVLAGEQLSVDEAREAIAFLRQDRMTAIASTGSSKTSGGKKAKSERIANAVDLLNELMP